MSAGTKRAYPEVAIACTIFGMTGIFLEHIRGMEIGPILFYRLFFGFLTIVFYLALTGRYSEVRLGKKKGNLLVQGSFIAITMFSFLVAVKNTSVSIAILLQYTAPVYVTLLAPLVLKEKIGPWSMFALLLAVFGVVQVVRPEAGFSGIELNSAYVTGVVFGMLAGITYGASIINIRYLKNEYSSISLAFWGLAISTLLSAPWAFEVSLETLRENLPILFLFGFLSMGIAELLCVDGLSRLAAQTGSILALTEPVAGIFFDYTILDVPFRLSTVLGCVLILSSAVLVSFDNTPVVPIPNIVPRRKKE